MREPLQFLLDHPRRCYTLLFPRNVTWILFGILLVLVGFEPPALTILSWMRAYWAPVGLLCGIIGLVLVLLDNKNKD